MDQTDEDAPVPFGINADNGLPLNGLTDEVIHDLLGRKAEPTAETLALSSRVDPANISFATEGYVDPSDLAQAGWGVIYAPSVSQAVKDALAPLIERRKAQAQPFKIFDGSDGYRPGDTANDWLKRRNVRMDVVDPEKGVPFYLLLVGPPDELPFEFQYSLDIYWAAGRLWFETADEFRRYAESVVKYETSVSVPTLRRGAIFATEHDFDEATQLFMRQVAKPLAEGENGGTTVWKRQSFGLQTLLSERATKAALIEVLRGQAQPTPALLLSGSHGMQFSLGDSRQAHAQGAIVCQDWIRSGPVKADHWLSAADVPDDARLEGMMHFFFACHGGGCTQFDDFDRLNKAPKRIADKPFLARLPQRLLGHPNGGALAVLAHVERAWAYSFQGQRGGSQIQGFRDVIGRLLNGQRIGQATDMFNLRWASIATELSDMQADAAKGVDVSLRRLGNLWVSRDDARNFVVLGDPAVRLRVEDMPPT
ncbi:MULTISPECIES: C25 family cysteine peptidase [Sinorhizobium]|uniref:C25 family cysteine peptidase n=1 Tax=Sinorhizobium TaxID=28105 RepID=UPI0024B19B70|nr:C25 family cysteine peptidase [Sinorhizobium terangae]WFU51895.1 C25 family cysteine peptidase [Sinorhizobium terangae]